jgi:hypothetical protein|tara:strand:- start:266 stop:763 length:498 start_codon:yes stop_codon:yes gene_type:complete
MKSLIDLDATLNKRYGLFLFMAYSGNFKPKNPQKYKGDHNNIIYRSMWEKKFMIFCDLNSTIVEWGSEEVIIPYRCPTDGKVHRYYPDFYIKVVNKAGQKKKYLIEVKPKKQTIPPNEKPKKKTATWKREVLTFMKNNAKWEAAKDFCEDRQMNFLILTEDHLGV